MLSKNIAFTIRGKKLKLQSKHLSRFNIYSFSKKACCYWKSDSERQKNQKKETIGTFFKLIDSLVEPVTLYECECWGHSQKSKFLQIKLSNSICQSESKY